MRRGFRQFFAAAALAALLPAVAWGQIFSDDAARAAARENRDQINTITALLRDLNAKLSRLEQVSAQTAALTQKQQQMEAQLRSFSGKLEELEKVLRDSLRQNQHETRFRALEAQLGEAQAEAAALRADLTEMGQYIALPPEEELYASAYAVYQNNDMQAAISGFGRVLKYYPQGQFAANSYYWLGQAHLAMQDFAAAQRSAEQLIANYPQGDRRADAMLLNARALAGLGEDEQARVQLQALISEHPTSLAADSARQLLAQ